MKIQNETMGSALTKGKGILHILIAISFLYELSGFILNSLGFVHHDVSFFNIGLAIAALVLDYMIAWWFGGMIEKGEWYGFGANTKVWDIVCTAIGGIGAFLLAWLFPDNVWITWICRAGMVAFVFKVGYMFKNRVKVEVEVVKWPKPVKYAIWFSGGLFVFFVIMEATR